MIDHDKHRREEMRWHILAGLHMSQPQGAEDELLWKVLRSQYPDVTIAEVRVQMNYLFERSLVHLSDVQMYPWVGKITRHGVDVVEYTVAVEPGIARPLRA